MNSEPSVGPGPLERDAPAASGAAALPRPADHAPASARLLSLFEVVLCSGYPTQLLLTGMFLGLGLMPLELGRVSIVALSLLLLVDAFLVMALVLLFLRARGERPTAVLFAARRVRREVALGVLLVPLLFLTLVAVTLAVQRLAPWLHNVSTNPFEHILRSPLHTAAFAAVAMLAGGVREEMQRAFVLHRFEQHLGGAPLGLVVFSAAFGLGHVLQGYDAAIITGLFGLLWGLVYLARRSIVAPMVSHAVFNLIEVVAHSAWL